MADLSQYSTEQLKAMLAQSQPQQPQQMIGTDLSAIPTDQLKAMLVQHPEVQQDPGILSQVGRQLGLTGRYALEGIGNAIGVVTDPFSQLADSAIPRDKKLSGLITGKNEAPRVMPMGQSAGALADYLGLPKPEGSLEKNIAGASKALVSAGTNAGAGIAAAAPELAANFGGQALASMLGGGAQESAKNAGAGEGGQALAGLLGSIVPGAATSGASALTRGLLRGSNADNILENLAAFQAAGTTPSVGQATENPLARGIESLLAKVPGGSGVMAKKANQQAEDIGAQMGRYADQLAPGSDPTQAGIAIQSGITGEGGFIDLFKKQAASLYDAVDQHMDPSTPVPMSATQDFLAKATKPTPGAEATSSILANPKLAQIAQAVIQDASQTGALPYTAVKALRSRVGDMLADSGLTSDVPKGQLKQLYGALSTDMRQTTARNPAAFIANNTAENFYRNGMGQIDNIENVVGKAGGPEKVFGAALSGTREGATTLNNVMSALRPEEQNVVSSAVVRRMGLANPGAQNDAGDVFSTSSFLTNWNKLSPQAKSVLFKNDSDMKANLDKIAQVTSNLREGSKVFQNPSGTSQGLTQISTATGAAVAALSGNVAGLAAIGGGVGGANLMARAMTNPTFVKWLARNTNAPVEVLPAQLSYLANLGDKNKDPDLTQIAQVIGSGL